MSSFTLASFAPVFVYDANGIGKNKTREGRKVYAIRGQDGDGMKFYLGYFGSPQMVHIPEGFETDGPSIPTIKSPGWLKLAGLVTWLVPQWAKEKAMKSAAIHDYLCEHPLYERPAADAEFWAAMHAEGTPPFWRKVFFDCVISNKSKAVFNDPAIFKDGQLDLFKPTGPGA